MQVFVIEGIQENPERQINFLQCIKRLQKYQPLIDINNNSTNNLWDPQILIPELFLSDDQFQNLQFSKIPQYLCLQVIN